MHQTGRVSIAYELSHCIVCGHADADVVATSDDLRDEVEWLWEYHQQRLKPGTPPDHLIDRVAFSQAPALQLVRCRECGLVYRNPAERAHELQTIYAKASPSDDVLRGLHETQLPAMRTQARMLREVLNAHAISEVVGLEVGSYAGGFLAAARECDMSFEGVDVNRAANAFVRSMGFAAHDGELASMPADRAFGCVAIWNTFDQLADPRGTLTTARRLLREGGVLALRVPNGGVYARRRARRSSWAMLAQNNLLTFPYRWGFTPTSLRRLLRETGFRVRRSRADVLVPIADEWTEPWARDEERAIKAGIKRSIAARSQGRTASAPWFEVYATRE